MDELVRQVSERTGISDAQARQAVEIIVNTIKDRLPPQFAAQVDAVVSGQASGDALNQTLGGLGGMFGGKK